VESQRQFIQEVGKPNCGAAFDAWAPSVHCANLIRQNERPQTDNAGLSSANLPSGRLRGIDGPKT
jgi:hypothetical protein